MSSTIPGLQVEKGQDLPVQVASTDADKANLLNSFFTKQTRLFQYPSSVPDLRLSSSEWEFSASLFITLSAEDKLKFWNEQSQKRREERENKLGVLQEQHKEEINIIELFMRSIWKENSQVMILFLLSILAFVPICTFQYIAFLFHCWRNWGFLSLQVPTLPVIQEQLLRLMCWQERPSLVEEA